MATGCQTNYHWICRSYARSWGFEKRNNVIFTTFITLSITVKTFPIPANHNFCDTFSFFTKRCIKKLPVNFFPTENISVFYFYGDQLLDNFLPELRREVLRGLQQDIYFSLKRCLRLNEPLGCCFFVFKVCWTGRSCFLARVAKPEVNEYNPTSQTYRLISQTFQRTKWGFQ